MTTMLVIGDDAGPTGSGAHLLALLETVHGCHPAVDLHVFLLHGGPLVHRFQALGPTTVVDWYDRRADHRRVAAVFRGKRKQRWLARGIDRLSSARLPRLLPPVSADVVLIGAMNDHARALARGADGERVEIDVDVADPANAAEAVCHVLDRVATR